MKPKATRIDRVHVFGSQQNGFVIGNHSVVSNCTAVLNGTNGISIPGGLATVSDCMILDNTGAGVRVDGLVNLIESSQIYRNGTGVYFRFASQGIARGNDILYSTGFDVFFDSGTSLNRVYNGALCDVTNSGSADNQTFSNIIMC